jgi:beta-lactamase superfamily II metal-dependent hydrolase
LDVGHGDCTIIEHPSGRVTVIDLNETNYKSCILYIRALLYKRNNNIIHRYIQTHPDMDHMRGLSRLLSEFDVLNFWDTRNTKTISSFTSDNDRLDWCTYKNIQEKQHYFQGNNYSYFNEDNIEILSPSRTITYEANYQQNHNNHSYILRITHGKASIILGGDAESKIWDALAEQGHLHQCTIFKAPHHGRDSGYSLKALKYLNPQHIVTSVGTKPETDAHSKYSNYGQVYSTRYHGNIILEVDSFGECKWHFEKNDPNSWEKYLKTAWDISYKRLFGEPFQKDLA